MSATVDAPASPWWWTHDSVENVAAPLDPTADDAAAHSLSAIVMRTSDHVRSHIAALRPYLAASATSPCIDDAQLYTQMQWGALLQPLLMQLRKAMARAWEERVLEQAEATAAAAAAVSSNGSSTDFGFVASAAMAAAQQEAADATDLVLLRRLRVVQQRVYLSFLKAFLQGLAAGVRAVVAQEDEEKTATAEDADGVARGVALMLDGVLADMLAFATASSNDRVAAPDSAEGQATKPRHRHPHSSAANVSNTAGDWFGGMMPQYVRAVRHNEQQQLVAADAPSLPSLALCLVSYIGVFVQDGGLQLLPSEQSAQLPLFSARVHDVYLRHLAARRAMASTPTTTATVSPSRDAAAYIEEAVRFVRQLSESQLYRDASGVSVSAEDDDDCTALFRTAAATPGVDYSVVSLLSLSTFAACSRLLAQLDAWWTACEGSLMRLRSDVSSAAGAPENEQAVAEAVASRAAALKAAEEAWLALRGQAVLFSRVLACYADTTLLLPPFAALLTRLFHPAELSSSPSEAWKHCLREMHDVLRSSTLLRGTTVQTDSSRGHSSRGRSGAAAAAAAAAAAMSPSSARVARVHHRHTGGDTFATASYGYASSLISRCAAGAAAVPALPDGCAVTRSADIPPAVLPLTFSLLQVPLMVLQDGVLPALVSGTLVAPSLCVDPVVGLKLHLPERATTSGGEEATSEAATPQRSSPPSSAASLLSARAQFVSAANMTAAEILALSFPRHYRLMSVLDLAMQYGVLRAQELTSAAGDAVAWVPASELLAVFAQMVGAALDEFFALLQHGAADEVNASSVLMFYIAVFRMLPSSALPHLRAALATFLGESGGRLVPYVRFHVVEKRRYGLVAVFLPILRALGLDYTSVEDSEVSLGLAAGPALAFAWEMPRLFFWRYEDTPVADVAWSAQAAAQTYLSELLTSNVDAITAAMLDIMREACAVAQRRAGKGSTMSTATTTTSSSGHCSGSRASLRSQFSYMSLGLDTMTAFFYAMCRWCTVQLPGSHSTASNNIPLDSLKAAVSAMCAPCNKQTTTTGPVRLPILMALRERISDGGGGGVDTSKEEVRTPYRAVTWISGCSYADVDPAHLQACARRLLRDFTTSLGKHASVRTLLTVRSIVEQRLKVEDAAAAQAAAVAAVTAEVRADLQDMMDRQHQQWAREQAENGEEKRKSVPQVTAASATVEESTEAQANPRREGLPDSQQEDKAASETAKEEAVTAGTAAEGEMEPVVVEEAAAAPPSVLAAAEFRRYVDSLLDAILARARLSVVDGAVSATNLLHLMRALSVPTLPIAMTAQDRQRMCERYVVKLTGSMGDLTRAEALASACSLQLVLATIVIPFKKSFLVTVPSRRVFHGVLSDSEADAFKMVRYTFGDVVTCIDKRSDDSAAPVTLLDDWKTFLLLEQTGQTIALVRSVLDKVRVSVRRRVLKMRSTCVEAMKRRLQQLEREVAASTESTEDVQQLFTLHPPPTMVKPMVVAVVAPSTAAAAAAAGTRDSETRRSGRSGQRSGQSRHEQGRERGRDGSGGGKSSSPSSASAAAASSSARDVPRGDRGGGDRKRGRGEENSGRDQPVKKRRSSRGARGQRGGGRR